MTILPHELYEKILSHTDDIELWKSWSLVAKAFCPSAQRFLFQVVSVHGRRVNEAGSQSFIHAKMQLVGSFPPSPHHYAHVLEINVAFGHLQLAKLESQLGEVLVALTNLRSLNFRHGSSSTSWMCLDLRLKKDLIEDVFPRLRILGLHGISDIPFLAIFSASRCLYHLSIGRYDGAAENESMERKFIPKIQSLTLDMYETDKFMNEPSLIQAFHNRAKSVKALSLVNRFWGIDASEGFLHNMDDFLSGFASNLTHLHLSRDTYSKITDPEGSWVDSLPLSMLASLEILQFEVDDSGQLLNWSWSIFSIGCLFFRWLAKELLNVHPRSALSQIILDLNNVEYSPPFFEVQVWGDLDQRLGVDSSLPHFERFRLRLNRPSSVNISEHLGWLQAALPLCAAKGFLTVERWRDPKAMINSAIQESCSDVV